MNRIFNQTLALLLSLALSILAQEMKSPHALPRFQKVAGGYRPVGDARGITRENLQAASTPQLIYTADSLMIKLGVLRLPDTLTFSQSHVPANFSEYIWSAWWDVDGDSTNGYLGFDLHIGLTHFKFPGARPFRDTAINATQHEVVEWTNRNGSITGQTKHFNLPVRLDPSNSNVLIMTAPKSWVEIAKIKPDMPCALITSYYAPNGFKEDTLVVRDAAVDRTGEVAYDFIDIVSGAQGVTTQVEEQQASPVRFRLEQNYPNPFNPSTTIAYELPAPAHVTLKIYDVLGKEIFTLVDEKQFSGSKSASWRGVNQFGQRVSGGVYVYVLQVNNQVQQRKMLFLP